MPRIIANVSFFIRFYDLNPSRKDQCIYFVQEEPPRRCKWYCSDRQRGRDNERAIELRQTILSTASVYISLDILREFILSNCCRKAWHRSRIEDDRLLIPLAERWKAEIQRHVAESNPTISIPPIVGSSPIPVTRNVSAVSNATAFNAVSSSTLNRQPNASPDFITDTTSSRPPARTEIVLFGSPARSNAAGFYFQPPERLQASDLLSVANSPSQHTSICQAPIESEFRPFIDSPGPSDCVSSKMRKPLDHQKRDFETGSLYMFDRDSSPGHVKIGWTAGSVEGRLIDWSGCGYVPNPLFQVHGVAFAHRVETLTHHELIKEWRAERECKNKRCGRSHCEWFEVGKERAMQVLGGWADLFKKHQPYDSTGLLKDQWRDVIERMDRKKVLVTVESLLEHHARALDDTIEELRVRIASLTGEEPTLAKENSPTNRDALPKEELPAKIPHPKEKEKELAISLPIQMPPPKAAPHFKPGPLLGTEFLYRAKHQDRSGSPPRNEQTRITRSAFRRDQQLLFVAESSSKIQPISKAEPVLEIARPRRMLQTKKRKPVTPSAAASPPASSGSQRNLNGSTDAPPLTGSSLKSNLLTRPETERISNPQVNLLADIMDDVLSFSTVKHGPITETRTETGESDGGAAKSRELQTPRSFKTSLLIDDLYDRSPVVNPNVVLKGSSGLTVSEREVPPDFEVDSQA